MERKIAVHCELYSDEIVSLTLVLVAVLALASA